MTVLLAGLAAIAVGVVMLVTLLRRNDRRVEHDDPSINQSGGPGFDDENDQRQSQ